jgi:hypothetical protein
MKKIIFCLVYCIFFAHTLNAIGSIFFDTVNFPEVYDHLQAVSRLIITSPQTMSSIQCGYILANNPNTFVCKGNGVMASRQVAASCDNNRGLLCMGFGSGRTCICILNQLSVNNKKESHYEY